MNKKNKIIIVFILIGILTSVSIVLINFNSFTKKPEEIEPPIVSEPEPVSYLNEIKGKELKEDIKKLIIEYMDVYYSSMKTLEEKDMTYLFENPNGEAAFINQTALSLLIEIRKMKTNDLTLSEAKYDLEVEKIEESKDIITVVLKESNYLHFNFMKDIESKIYNIENTFVIRKVDDTYKIVEYNKVQDFFVMITDQYSSGGKEKLDQIKNNYLDIIKKNIKKDQQNYSAFLKGEDFHPKTCDHNFDRDSALEYAKKWVNTRNKEWSTFDANCQNYASQVIYNGGIPMDYQGNAIEHLQWKFYDTSYNEKQVASGYIYTWTYVPYFYTYAKNNTGSGLCADVDVNVYYAEAGDIIHVGTNVTDMGPGKHSVVSMGPYKKENKVIDILVNSNTVDLENYPLSAYVYPYVSLIKIYGYND